MKNDNIIELKKRLKDNAKEDTALLVKSMDALDSAIDDETPLVDVMEALATIVAITANGVGISPTMIMTCFAQTLEAIYEFEQVIDD